MKHRYRSAQVKAAVKVNSEKLLFNWQMGRDLVQKKAEERWGAGVVEQVSNQVSSEKLQRLVGEILHQPGAELIHQTI